MKSASHNSPATPRRAGKLNWFRRSGDSCHLLPDRRRAVLVLGTCLLAPLVMLAAEYAIDWSTLDGGGGTSTGGVYSVTGTIGQPDAGGPMTNGQYSVVGGFWGMIAAVQTPGAPTLSVTRTATNTVAVSWPLPDTGWKLQATTNLVPSGSVWTEIPPSYATNATSLYFVEPTPVGNKFYRLHKP